MTSKTNTAEAIGRGNAPAIAIFVFGHRAYGHAAENLALTLREHSPDVPVHLWISDELSTSMHLDHSRFTEVHTLAPNAYADGPGALKLNVHDILPDGDWLYVDADMLCLSDIGPTLDRLQAHDFAIDVRGEGGEADNIPYTPWATQATIKAVNGFDDGATYYGVQSSWLWIRKGSKDAEAVFRIAKACKYRPEDLKEQWGQSIPDELCIATALTAMKYRPHTEAMTFYGSDNAYKGLTEASQHHVFACLYGDVGRHRLVRTTWMDAYDRYVRKMYRTNGLTMRMDVYTIMRNKYVNHANSQVLRKAKAAPAGIPT